jgi:hypothetical protein
MGERVKSKRRIMKEFEISELSSVDRPAQAPARALLMKRADDEDLEKGKGNPNHKGKGAGGGQFTSGGGSSGGGSSDAKFKNTAEQIGTALNANRAKENQLRAAGDSEAANAIYLENKSKARALLVASGMSAKEFDRKMLDMAGGKRINVKMVRLFPDLAKSAEVDKDYPATVCQQVQAVDFDTVLAEQEAREAVSEIGEDLREKWYALQRSFNTIAADETIAAPDKITAMQTSMQQYIDSLAEQSDEIAESMTKALTAVPVVAELLAKDAPTEGDDPMTDAEKKQLDELQKNVAELTKQLAAATSAEPAKKAADLQEALTAAQAQVTELTEKAEKAEAEKVEAVIKAGMSDAEKAAVDKMDDKAKAEWMKLSPEDRKKKMTKAADEDPVVYKSANGAEFRKSDDPRLIEMAKRADDLEKSNAEEIEKRLNAEFTKQAESEPFTFYKGEVAGKVKVARAISKIDDADVRKSLEDMLEVGGKAIGAAFKSLGHQDVNVQKSASDFNKRVDDIMARDKIGKSKAMSKARAEYPDEFAAYQAAGAPAN